MPTLKLVRSWPQGINARKPRVYMSSQCNHLTRLHLSGLYIFIHCCHSLVFIFFDLFPIGHQLKLWTPRWFPGCRQENCPWALCVLFVLTKEPGGNFCFHKEKALRSFLRNSIAYLHRVLKYLPLLGSVGTHSPIIRLLCVLL